MGPIPVVRMEAVGTTAPSTWPSLPRQVPAEALYLSPALGPAQDSIHDLCPREGLEGDLELCRQLDLSPRGSLLCVSEHPHQEEK